MAKIPVAGPWITDKEVAYVADAAATAWYGDANKYNRRFEDAFAAYVGRAHAMALPSCTSAIHLALAALDVGPGDEVIVPDLTWIASAAPISYVGATPVFCDVEPDTWCMSAKSFEQCITPRTRAAIPVDLYGGMPDMDAVLEVAARHSVALIEDAAEAIGSEYHGHRAGAFGTASVFSFHGSKTLTTGEGGMLVTDDAALFERAQVLRDHGRKPGDRYFYNNEVAFKYKMSSLQAALGLAQLERIDELVARKREIFGWYRKHLLGVPGITLNAEPARTLNTYWMVTVVLDPAAGGKQELMTHFDTLGIDSRPVFHPLSSLPAYASVPAAATARSRNPESYRLGSQGVNLPSALNLSEADVREVCDSLTSFMEGARRSAPLAGGDRRR